MDESFEEYLKRHTGGGTEGLPKWLVEKWRVCWKKNNDTWRNRC